MEFVEITYYQVIAVHLEQLPHHQCREQERTTCSGGWVGGPGPLLANSERVSNTNQLLTITPP